MRNYDMWIYIIGFVMFVLGWIASSVNYNHRIKQLKKKIEEIKIKSNDLYSDGVLAGWDSLAANPDAMKRELTRMENMRSIPRPD